MLGLQLSPPTLYPQGLTQCWTHCSCSVNISGVNTIKHTSTEKCEGSSMWTGKRWNWRLDLTQISDWKGDGSRPVHWSNWAKAQTARQYQLPETQGPWSWKKRWKRCPESCPRLHSHLDQPLGPGHWVSRPLWVQAMWGPDHGGVQATGGPGHCGSRPLWVQTTVGSGPLGVQTTGGPGHCGVQTMVGSRPLGVQTTGGPGHGGIQATVGSSKSPLGRWRSSSLSSRLQPTACWTGPGDPTEGQTNSANKSPWIHLKAKATGGQDGCWGWNQLPSGLLVTEWEGLTKKVW